MKNNPLTRLAFIDVAKGLGIIAVVVGHVFPPGLLHNLIFVFHMPLFFFISGYLFKPKEDKAFVAAKAQQLLVPYVFFLVVVYALQNQAIFASGGFSFSEGVLLWSKAALGGRWLYGHTSAFWFVPVMFIVLLSANWLLRKTGPSTVLFISLASLTAAYLNAAFFSSLKVPLNANVALAALPLFLTGYFFKQGLVKMPALVSALLLALTAAAACVDRLPELDMKMASYGLPVLSFAAAVAVTLLLFQVSKWIAEKIAPLSNAVASAGQASLVIMFLHQPVQILVQAHLTENLFLRIVLGLLVPYAFYRMFKTHSFFRALFLGSPEDFAKLSSGLQTVFGHLRLRPKP